MNLGQLIGELRMRAEDAEERLRGGVAVESAKPLAAKPRGQRQHQVMDLLEDGRAVDVSTVAEAIGVSGAHAGVLLHTMAAKGLISRHGRSHGYRYTKPGVPGPANGLA